MGIVYDPVNHHPFTVDMAVAVHDMFDGGARAAAIDLYLAYEVREKLGYDLDAWLALPDWKSDLIIKRLKRISEAKKNPPPDVNDPAGNNPQGKNPQASKLPPKRPRRTSAPPKKPVKR